MKIGRYGLASVLSMLSKMNAKGLNSFFCVNSSVMLFRSNSILLYDSYS